MSAWHGEQSLKDAVIDRLEEHRRLDRIAQGVYWENDRGCALGCLTHHNEDSHEAAERLFGLPLETGHLIEGIFESLPKEECAWWVVASAKSIPAGADLSKLRYRLSAWLLREETGLLRFTNENREAIELSRSLNQRVVDGGSVSNKEWSAAESAARSAAESAAESAAWSAAESAARLAARSAAWSAARPAAWSAAWSAARLAARSAARPAAWSAARPAAWSAAWSAARLAARSAAWSAAWSAAESAAESAARSAADSAAIRKIAEKTIELFESSPVVDSTANDECGECIIEARAVLASRLI